MTTEKHTAIDEKALTTAVIQTEMLPSDCRYIIEAYEAAKQQVDETPKPVEAQEGTALYDLQSLCYMLRDGLAIAVSLGKGDDYIVKHWKEIHAALSAAKQQPTTDTQQASQPTHSEHVKSTSKLNLSAQPDKAEVDLDTAEWLSTIEDYAKQDDWHTKLVGSDIRMLCGLIRRYQAAQTKKDEL